MQIEIGDFVEIVNCDNIGFVGILDNEFMRDGILTFCVVSEIDGDEFYYATELRLFKKS